MLDLTRVSRLCVDSLLRKQDILFTLFVKVFCVKKHDTFQQYSRDFPTAQQAFKPY
jgi:hypothetical protein